MASGAPKMSADIVRVVGPVGTELELHGQTCGDPQGKVDGEQLAQNLVISL